MATPAPAVPPSVSNGQSGPKPMAPSTSTPSAKGDQALPGGKREASIDMLFGGEKKPTPARPAATPAKAPSQKAPTQVTNNSAKPTTPAGSAQKPSSTTPSKPATSTSGQAKSAVNLSAAAQKPPQQPAQKPPASTGAASKPSTSAAPAKAAPSTSTPTSAPKPTASAPPKSNTSAIASAPVVKSERPDSQKQASSSSSGEIKPSASVTPVKSTTSIKEPTSSPSKPAPLPVKEEKHKVKEHKKKRHKSESEEEEEEAEAEEEDEEDVKPKSKSKPKDSKSKAKSNSSPSSSGASPQKKKRVKEEEETEVWRWWEEKKKHTDETHKWTFLEHRGPLFPPPYEPLPSDVHFYYDGRPMKLAPAAEEVASFYGQMLKHDYTSKASFNKNFFEDWRRTMTHEERQKITDLTKCNFGEINSYFERRSEERKARGKEERLKEKEEKEEIQKEYGTATLDGHKEKIANYRIEPPGLFRGRGNHPKMGKLKRRVQPEDVIINCSKDAKVPPPPPGHKWKEVRHDNTVTWLATWTENVMGQNKYIMLNPSSKLKGEKDWKKYETARKLHTIINNIRKNYKNDWKAHETEVRQRAVALYFIDKLALRAGNEKDEDEADTVGCCSLRVEHIRLHDSLMIDNEEKDYVVEFDFLGKDSIRYFNRVPVEKRVFKNLKIFLRDKQPTDELFDRLTTQKMNKHLHDIMDGLTAKVFRTYNASRTLEEQLDKQMNELKDDASVAEKMLAYNRANRSVAILCNHQRSVPKNFTKQMEDMEKKIAEKHKQVKQAKKEAKQAKADYKASRTDQTKKEYEKKKKAYLKMVEQQRKLEVTATDRDENKTIALSTSKLNYSDPRISVAWCKKYEVPIEKVYNKTQREKFRWAIDMADEDYRFIEIK